MKKSVFYQLFMPLVLSMFFCSCGTIYQLGRASSQGYAHLINYSKQQQEEYEEALKTRPDLTKEQFLAEKREARMQAEYEKAKETRPSLTYEQFVDEEESKIQQMKEKQ